MAKVAAKNICNGMIFEIVKKPYKDQGIQMVDWALTTSFEVWSSHWITFKSNTSLVSGTTTPNVPLTITSSGAFSGFDVSVVDSKIEDYTKELGYGIFSIRFGFHGTFTGAKGINTKIINMIKKAPGFKVHLIHLIDNEFLNKNQEMDHLVQNINHSSPDYQDALHSKIVTWYSGGKLELVILISSLSNSKLY